MHIVDTHTGFQNATALRGKLPSEIWAMFVKCWATVYTGYPALILFDQEYGFVLRSFRDLSSAHGTFLQFSGAHSHNSISIGETCHAALRTVFRKLRAQ